MLLAAASSLAADDIKPKKPGAPSAQAIGQSKPYAAGVAIDWHRRSVEVVGRVVLRDGPLELFACSARTREHESIVAIDARPLHLHQAMGLIGLEPGSPGRFDPKTERWIAPTGDTLRLRLRYRLSEYGQ